MYFICSLLHQCLSRQVPQPTQSKYLWEEDKTNELRQQISMGLVSNLQMQIPPGNKCVFYQSEKGNWRSGQLEHSEPKVG